MASPAGSKITCLIFDVDDTLYDVSTGFTAHRNGDVVQSFMVEKFGFPTKASAKAIRDEYFEKYHSTAKAITVAESEGKLPPDAPRFNPQDLAEYWAANLNFSLLGSPKTDFLGDLKACPLKLVAFSNGPRVYVKKVLVEMGLWEVFGDDRLFAVDDVLPHCKPEKAAFEIVFQKLGVKAEECVMVEDSMKNIRKAKELGLKTVLVAGRGHGSAPTDGTKTTGHRILPSDAPLASDPAVDVCIEVVEEMRNALPGLWASTPYF